jgi:hypothetical protein
MNDKQKSVIDKFKNTVSEAVRNMASSMTPPTEENGKRGLRRPTSKSTSPKQRTLQLCRLRCLPLRLGNQRLALRRSQPAARPKP